MSDSRFRVLAVLIMAATGLAVWLAARATAQPGPIAATASIAVAGATLLLALVTYRAVTDARQSSFTAQRALARPLLAPTNPIDQGDLPNARERMIDIANMGNGAALNIWGLLMPFSEPIQGLPRQLSMRFPFPLPPSAVMPMKFSQGGTMFLEQDAVAGVPFSVPAELAPDEGFPDTQDRKDRVVARLTLSYEDIFSQIHSAVFDLSQQNEWAAVRIQQGIAAGIREIDDEKTKARKRRRARLGAR